MSTIIMSQCWPLDGMSTIQKAVLIALADLADERGSCWPTVSIIASRVCACERAVQGAIQWLERAGALTAVRRPGKVAIYMITPELYLAPAAGEAA